MIAIVDADSIAYAAGYTDEPTLMEMCCDNYVKDIMAATGATEMMGFIESPEWKQNFRKYVAVSKPYKSNRRSAKPPFMVDAKYYLKTKCGFHFVNYMEAEDAMSIMAQRIGLDNCVKCCIDKDCQCLPGNFYDYRKKLSFSVSYEEAQHNLFHQILTGDGVDAIPGIPGMGPVGADKVLAGEGEKRLLVAAAYKRAGLSYGYLLEQARLIKILEEHGEKPFSPVTQEEWAELPEKPL